MAPILGIAEPIRPFSVLFQPMPCKVRTYLYFEKVQNGDMSWVRGSPGSILKAWRWYMGFTGRRNLDQQLLEGTSRSHPELGANAATHIWHVLWVFSENLP